jgi:GTP-binding protein
MPPAPAKQLRNIVIIAHVDHGKTTLVDCLLRQSGQFRETQLKGEQILDSNDLERERGITILAKNIALEYRGIKINIIDTPGHADFGGEVERVLKMADGALLLIDAAEGPMPQTRFVLTKALAVGLKPIVIINKIDRPDARPVQVLNEAHELIVDLGGESFIEDFRYLFMSGRQGIARRELSDGDQDLRPLLDAIVNYVPSPRVGQANKLQMQVANIDWSEFVGRIAIGRIFSGQVRQGQNILLMQADDRQTIAKVGSVHVFDKLGRTEVESASAGDIVAIVGLEGVEIGDTVVDVDHPVAMPRIQVDEPTLEMVFTINSSPLSGREGKYVTGRQLRERLMRELERNVALRVRATEGSDVFHVSGRGVLHLAVLIETMRREGYELSVGKPHVVYKTINGIRCEPFESLVVEVPTDKLGPVMEMIGQRRGELGQMHTRDQYTQALFAIPARGLIGLRTRLLNATQGTAVLHHRFLDYRPAEGTIAGRVNGVYVSMVSGRAVGYALFNLQDRADMFVAPGDEVYEGMIVGENARDNDLSVNPTKEKKLTNVRASGSDENILLKPPRQFTLEGALEYVEDDELVEITPTKIRLRKAVLREADRRRLGRAALDAV